MLFQENGTLKGLLQPHGSFLWPRFFKPTDSESSKEFIPALNLNQPNLGFPCCRSFFRPNFCATVAKVAVDLEARPGTEDLRLTEKVYHKNVDVLCLLYFLLKGIFHVPCSFIRVIASILTSRSIIMWPSLSSVVIVGHHRRKFSLLPLPTSPWNQATVYRTASPYHAMFVTFAWPQKSSNSEKIPCLQKGSDYKFVMRKGQSNANWNNRNKKQERLFFGC